MILSHDSVLIELKNFRGSVAFSSDPSEVDVKVEDVFVGSCAMQAHEGDENA